MFGYLLWPGHAACRLSLSRCRDSGDLESLRRVQGQRIRMGRDTRWQVSSLEVLTNQDFLLNLDVFLTNVCFYDTIASEFLWPTSSQTDDQVAMMQWWLVTIKSQLNKRSSCTRSQLAEVLCDVAIMDLFLAKKKSMTETSAFKIWKLATCPGTSLE